MMNIPDMKCRNRLSLFMLLVLLTGPVLSAQNIVVSEGTTVTLPGGSLLIKGLLLNNGTINSYGDLTLLSDQDGTSLIDGAGTGMINGEIIMQRWFNQAFGYRYISSPFASSTVSELADDIDLTDPFPTLYRYNEHSPTSGWVNYTDTSGILVPLSGYSANLGFMSDPLTMEIKGIVNDGDMSVTLYNHNKTYTEGFNLVGNPYPSPIDWDAEEGWTRTNIDDAVYYFRASDSDPYGGSYATYMNGLSSDGIVNNIIPSMQGFFVHVSDGAWPVTATLSVDNRARVRDMDHAFTKSGTAGEAGLLRLTACFSDDSSLFDPMVIYTDEKATFDFDGQLDALKLYNTDYNVPSFFSFGNDGSRLSINSIPGVVEQCSIRLGLRIEREGDIVFRIAALKGDDFCNIVSITDRTTGVTTDIAEGRCYRVALAAGDYTDRFWLNLSNTVTGVPEIPVAGEWARIYQNNGILKVEISLQDFKDGDLIIYNISGQPLYKYAVDGPGYHEFIPSVRDGIYLVRLGSGNNSMTRKIFLEKR
jgi:hypothetical protein